MFGTILALKGRLDPGEWIAEFGFTPTNYWWFPNWEDLLGFQFDRAPTRPVFPRRVKSVSQSIDEMLKDRKPVEGGPVERKPVVEIHMIPRTRPEAQALGMMALSGGPRDYRAIYQFKGEESPTKKPRAS